MRYQEAREMIQSTDYHEELQTIEELASGYEESGAINRLAMLSLNNPLVGASLCTACGSSVKRPSPSSVSSLQEPATKKQLIFLPPSSAPAAAVARSPPPDNTQFTSPPRDQTYVPGLRRTVSDVVNFSRTAISPPSLILKTQSPGNPKLDGSATASSPAATNTSLPPRPPPLRRSTSDPNQLLTSSTPPPAAARKSSESPNSCGSKRLDRMREMLQQLEQVMQEEEEEEEEKIGHEVDQKPEEAETQHETEEAVSVEKSGDSLIVHFKCPCKKTFQILLSGNNCYYKLM